MRKKNEFYKNLTIFILAGSLGVLLGHEHHLLEQDIARRQAEEAQERSAGFSFTSQPDTESLLGEIGKENLQQRGQEESWDSRQVSAGKTDDSGQEKAPGTSDSQPTGAKAQEPAEATLSVDVQPAMRVLLMTSGYEGYYHPSVTVEIQGEETTYTPEVLEEGQVIRLSSDGGGIAVPSIQRSQGTPVYSGVIEIRGEPDGLVVINELPLEEYLYGVVPSEMPADYEMEALKAQAVCARTYAWRQFLDEKLADHHAHVDDSVAFQVYNNIASDERSTQAVDETSGKILCQEGQPIQAYYFSTSSGATSTDEVWEPEEESGYLKSVACMYDAAEPWSKWQVFFPLSVLNERIRDRYGDIGSLISMEVLERSSGGAVKELRILTDQESRVVHNEYDIRALFSPKGLSIIRKDDSQTEGQNLLPSAYFTLDTVQTDGEMAGYRFVGGGYGHGVGMSQTGANHMAMEGKSCMEILDYFYKDVTVTQLEIS
ncbi:MAG: SpoIID/LytB domain-containing protein [Blautia sp.]|jgi:stage II sporulation protein D